jgi:monothiol glutaredoxin
MTLYQKEVKIMSENVMEKIKSQVASNKILIYMKGTKDFPRCGFSAATVEVFKELGYPFETVDVLEDEEIREGIKRFTNWPTIPQVFINGKFIGGCDITRELYARGELQQMVKEAFETDSK